MEGGVWTKLFALVVDMVSNLSASSNATQKQVASGPSPAAAGTDAVSTSTSNHVLRITRKTATNDAMFGEIRWDDTLICVSMERTAVAIPVGTFPGCKRYSPHLSMNVIGIDVPNRTDIECHPANYPSQLLGCIAAGSTVNSGALDNSREAFFRLMALVSQTFTVVVEEDFD